MTEYNFIAEKLNQETAENFSKRVVSLLPSARIHKDTGIGQANGMQFPIHNIHVTYEAANSLEAGLKHIAIAALAETARLENLGESFFK